MDERRDFKRYSCKSDCEIRIKKDVYKGFVVDYSDGLGLIANKAPLLKKGVTADVWILNSDEEIKVKVAWIRKMDNYVRIGVTRVGNLTGSLKAFRLADILTGMQRGTKTGILEVVSGSIEKRIYIKNGDMVFAGSSVIDDRLGEFFVKEGKITPEELDMASERMRKTGGKLGKALVDMSCVTPRELYQGVKAQVDNIILSLFSFEEGKFTFKEGPLPAGDFVTLIIRSADIIYRGIKRIQSPDYIKAMCPSMDTVLDLSQNPINIFQSLTLDNDDKKILYTVDGTNSLEKILYMSQSDEFTTLKAIAAFLSTGIARICGSGRAAEVVSLSDMMKNQVDITPDEFLASVEDLIEKIDSVDYYTFLGVDKQASEEDIQRAYYRISNRFHPDRHFSFPAHDIKAKLIKIFELATKANNTLLDHTGREKYNRSLDPHAHTASTEGDTGQEFRENAHFAEDELVQKFSIDDISTIIGDIQEENQQNVREDSEAPYELGIAYMEMGLMEEAIKELRTASEDPSKRVKCVKLIADCFMEQGDSQQAIEEFKKLESVLSADSREILEVKYDMAEMHVKNNEYDTACTILNEIQSVDPGYRDIAKLIKSVSKKVNASTNNKKIAT